MSTATSPAPTAEAVALWCERLDCRFAELQGELDGLIGATLTALSGQDGALAVWLDTARWLGRLGRGAAPQQAFLQVWPELARRVGADWLVSLRDALAVLQKSPNGRALAPLLHSLPGVAAHWRSAAMLTRYLDIVLDLMRCSSVSIHGSHGILPSEALPVLLAQAPRLAAQVEPEGLARWIDTGLRLHGSHPGRLAGYLGLQSADSRALLQRERHGTLLADAARPLELLLRSLWNQDGPLVPYELPIDADGSEAHRSSHLQPHIEPDGLRLPEVLHAQAGIAAPDRYRAMLCHLAAHRRWSQPRVADNLSPLQRLAVECFEDARVDLLTLRLYPGLRPLLLALHPLPAPDAADLSRQNGLRQRLTRMSRALLEPAPDWLDAVQQALRTRFLAALADGASDTATMAALALDWAACTRVASDQYADVVFTDTWVDYRDDNRHLWIYIEAGDEEESFERRQSRSEAPDDRLPPRLYPEWDEAAHSFRPDWVSVFDVLQPPGAAGDIEQLMQRHQHVARQLKRQLDALKPQQRTRLRHQEEGTELDLDVALGALIDWRSGLTPDPRLQMSTRTDGRDIAVLLLIDLSASVNDAVPGLPGETVLSLSRAAAALLAWAIDTLGDELAIAGFHSNTRDEVRYLHIKGFSEAWDDMPKARLAGAQGAWSTRMGAALRHAGHHLSGRRADKKLLLVLTDGQPADVDVTDPQHLVADAAQAVHALARQGLYSHCISLDPQADAYVGRIFGARHTVIDQVEQLPRRLPEVFVGLTR
ncbi:MAG: hypothetical protein RLY71_1492 [Pseudomonadota bacterium]|jgi:hypothetical protein